ncbi:CHAT domain-containing tetratricopeptide repeat protein [Pannonibacter sp. Pt2]|uniref:CHAT domain-containing tetratricopeptide repeat protein n=1 Tax=Pannonibacter anstelovis TaxID=3121537 RepID=A0ABU7ZIM5_9HYPH
MIRSLRNGSAALALAVSLGCFAAAHPALAQAQDDLSLPGDMSRYIGPAAKERDDLRKALTEELAEKDPERAAALVTELADKTAAAGGWPEAYKAIAVVAAPLLERLEGPRLDSFLFDFSVAAGNAGKKDQQDALLRQMVRTAEAEEGQASNRYRRAIVNKAYSLLSADRDDEAFAAIMAALDTLEASGDESHFFNTVPEAGDAFRSHADAEQGAEIYERGMTSPLFRTTTSPGRAFMMFNYAVFLRDIGKYDEALRLHLPAMNELFSIFGPESKEGYNAYDGLAQTMHAAGQLAGAEAAYSYMVPQMWRLFGGDDPDYWRVRNNHAAVLRSLKLPSDALIIDFDVYLKRHDKFGNAAPVTLASALNMAHDQLDLERWEDAERTLKPLEAIATDMDYAPRYIQMIAAWRDYVAYRSGVKAIEDAALRDTAGLEGRTAGTEQRLAYLDLYASEAERRGYDDLALTYRESARDVAYERFTDAHPLSFDAELARLRLLSRLKPEEAAEGFRQLDAAMSGWTRANVTAAGSLSAARSARILADDMLAAFADFARDNADAARHFAAALDSWKTLTRQTELDLRREAETTDDQAYRELILSYFRKFGRFRELVTGTLYTDELDPQRQEMEEARNALNEARAARGMPEVTPWFLGPVTVPEAVAEPEAGDVIVDLAVTRRWPVERRGYPDTYEIRAVISRPGQPPQVDQIGTIRMKDGEAPAGFVMKAIETRLAKVLASAAEGAGALYIIPDDSLYQWALAELRTGDGKRLGELVDVHLITSRAAYAYRDSHSRPEPGAGILLAGGLDYGPDASVLPLPGTASEVNEIAELAGAAGFKPSLLTGKMATEAGVRAGAESSSIIHLATHGFYREVDGGAERLTNTGFVLADLKDSWEGDNPSDNIVHAREVLDWDLSGAGLVVIAACETALGDPGVTATVRGLPMALSIAGARRSLLTIDNVPDQATSRFMIRFHEHLLGDGMTYSKAFIETKRDAWAGRIEGVDPELTYAFVLFEH